MTTSAWQITIIATRINSIISLALRNYMLNFRVLLSFIMVINLSTALLPNFFVNPFSKTKIANSKPWDQIFNDAKKSVVQIFTYSGEHNLLTPFKAPQVYLGRGTGFFLESEQIATNYHVIADAINNGIYLRISELGQEQFALEVEKIYPERDLAFLKLPEKEKARLKNMLKVTKLPSLPLAQNSDDIKEAQELMLVGFPLGFTKIKASLGECSGWHFHPKIGNMVQTTVPTNPGNSGGPYLNNQGEVVGICQGGFSGNNVENIAIFIPINTFYNAYKSSFQSSNKVICNPCWGFEFTPTTPHLNFLESNPLHQGIRITKVYQGGLAYEYGLFLVIKSQNMKFLEESY